MATTLQLIEGATTTDLNDGSATHLIDYTPQAGDLDQDTIKEQATILIDVATVALMDSEREEVNQRLYNAKARQSDHARDKTYVKFQPDGGADTWRSEVLEGKIINERNIHKEGWAIKKIEITIEWTRRNHWDGSEDQIPLTNTNGTDDISGLNVFNCNDGSGTPPNDQVNYVEIKAADVEGEIPGATRLEMVNNYATNSLRALWIGHNIIDPGNHVWNYEGEDATGGTPTVDANSSDGEYNRISVASGSVFSEYLTWSISGATVDDAKGGPMKVVIRFANGNNVTSVWWMIRLKRSTAVLWQSGRSKADANFAFCIRDILTFNFPPWLRGQTGNGAVDLVLAAQQETGGALNLDIDVLFLIPANSWRHLYLGNDNCANTERVVDDLIEGFQYVDDGSGTDKRSSVLATGSGIYVEPGKLQRLYFISHSNSGNTAEKDRKLTVKLFYRPRRVTL